jgi:hypothetical protein
VAYPQVLAGAAHVLAAAHGRLEFDFAIPALNTLLHHNGIGTDWQCRTGEDSHR